MPVKRFCILRLSALLVLLWASSALADETTQSGVYDPLPFFDAPKRIDATKPRYPRIAIMHRVCGEVRVALSISSNGEITDKKIIYSDHPEIFDSEAEKFTDTWRFEKKFDNGIAIPYQTIVPIKYRLGPEDDCMPPPSIKREAIATGAADISELDVAEYFTPSQKGAPMSFRLVNQNGKLVFQDKLPGGPISKINCFPACEYKKATSAEIDAFFPKHLRQGIELACITSTAWAFCRANSKTAAYNNTYTLIALFAKPATFLPLIRVPK